MTTPATAAATAPSCAVKPVALLFPKVIPLPLPLDLAVDPLVAAVVVPPRPPRPPVAVAVPAPETGYPAFVQSVSSSIERSSSD